VQEAHFSHFYGTTTYNERQIQKLKRASTAIKAKQIKGVPTYRVLDNRLYEQQMHYFPPTMMPFYHQSAAHLSIHRRRADIAYLCLNFAFLPQQLRE
jgi:hypothetical protein